MIRLNVANTPPRHASLYSLDADSFIMDTPDLVLLNLMMFPLKDCLHYSPEFGEYVDTCKFSPCYHEHEPICGIKAAQKLVIFIKDDMMLICLYVMI